MILNTIQLIILQFFSLSDIALYSYLPFAVNLFRWSFRAIVKAELRSYLSPSSHMIPSASLRLLSAAVSNIFLYTHVMWWGLISYIMSRKLSIYFTSGALHQTENSVFPWKREYFPKMSVRAFDEKSSRHSARISGNKWNLMN